MKRLSFLVILCVGAFGCACDGNGGRDAGPGIIELDGGPDGGPPGDGGPPPDGGPGPGCGMPQAPGQEGGNCRGGTTCLTGLQCAEELSSLMGSATTIGNIFGINSCTQSATRPGEADTVGSPSTVPMPFFPGGLCTRGCTPGVTGTCGECTSCSSSLGISDGFGAVGIDVNILTGPANYGITPAIMEGQPRPGICQQNCNWDPATPGGCPPGYTCDVGSNVCEQGCTSDAQCRIDWLVNRTEGLCQGDSGVGTCDMATRRCRYPGSASSASGSPCEGSEDCPADIGICLIGGRCSTYQCNVPDSTGMAARFPCPAEQICVGVGGNNSALCLGTCNTAADCFEGQACSPAGSTLPDGRTGLCFPICGDEGMTQAQADMMCQSGQRCLRGRLSDPDLGFCSNYCVPAGGPADPMAATCEADEVCTAVDGTSYGFCRALNQICFANDGCVGDQACEVLGFDFYGRCVGAPGEGTSCGTSADCNAAMNEECVIFDDANPATPPLTRGICRAPGGSCSASPRSSADMRILQPLLGDAQCIPSQRCNQTVATDPPSLGTCVDR